MNESPTRRASLEVLRAEASDELAMVVHERLRSGEDPWDFMQELPRHPTGKLYKRLIRDAYWGKRDSKIV